MDDPQEEWGESIIAKTQAWVIKESVFSAAAQRSFFSGCLNSPRPFHILTPEERESARQKIEELMRGYQPPEMLTIAPLDPCFLPAVSAPKCMQIRISHEDLAPDELYRSVPELEEQVLSAASDELF